MRTRLLPGARSLALAAVVLLGSAAPAAAQLPTSPNEEARRSGDRAPRPPEVFAPAGSDSLPADQLRPGMRLRVSAVGVGVLRPGVIQSVLSPDTLLFDIDATRRLLRVPLRDVTYMAVSTGRARGTPRVARGALVGAVIGLAAAFAGDVVNSGGEQCSGITRRRDCGEVTGKHLAFVVVGAFAGGVVGSRLEAGAGPHAWRPVQLPAADPAR